MMTVDIQALLPSSETDALLRTIGNTPLIPLLRIGQAFPGVRIFAKAEWFNPGGSVKDILDATSGNTGIAYAMIAARRGYRCKLLMPANASTERKKLLRAYGAEVDLTDPAEGSDGAFFAAQRLYKEQPDLYVYLDQYGNPENPRAHYETTGPEIIEQTAGKITHFLAGLGTSGTMMGTGKRLREFNRSIKLVAVQPEGPFHGLEGLKHMETTSHIPDLYDAKVPDQIVNVFTEAAQQMSKRLTREEGLYVGVSAGAAICVALKIAATIQEGTLVAICPDAGNRYQSEKFWEAT